MIWYVVSHLQQGVFLIWDKKVRHLSVKRQQNVPVSPKKYLDNTFHIASSWLGLKRRAAVSQLLVEY